ncbi:MAG: DUF1499 domain-containing protein [Pseudomonadota bacterium]
MTFLLGFSILVAVGLFYIRLAPSDPARWHKGTGQAEVIEKQGAGSYVFRAVIDADASDVLRKIDQAAMQTPRTSRFAGSVEEGQITYITRSLIFGFPDYTTVGVYGEAPQILEIYARLRFGRSDFGVNMRRAQAWRAVLD